MKIQVTEKAVIKDRSTRPNYNGTKTLKMAGLRITYEESNVLNEPR